MSNLLISTHRQTIPIYINSKIEVGKILTILWLDDRKFVFIFSIACLFYKYKKKKINVLKTKKLHNLLYNFALSIFAGTK